jgi:CheY-like chemotaxis protein
MSEVKTILLVDDDVDFVESNTVMLEAFGYRVISATDGSRALALASAEHPDLMILDIMMTYDTEGFDVAREVRSRPELRDMKILMVSGIVSEKKLGGMPKPDGQWLPVERVLEKPIDPPKLIAEVQRLLQGAGGGA